MPSDEPAEATEPHVNRWELTIVAEAEVIKAQQATSDAEEEVPQ